MGYYKNLEIALQVEEPDRLLPEPTGGLLTRRKLKNHRRETYWAPKHWVVTNRDMAIIWAMIPMAMALGFLLGILVGGQIV